MFEEYAASGKPCALPEVVLNRVWHVKADQSYDVFRNNQGNGLILLRTVSGHGELFTDGDHFTLTGNSMLIVKAGDIKRYRCTTDNWHFYWFEYDSEEDYLPVSELYDLHPVSRESIYLDNIFSMLRRNRQAERDLAAATFVFLLNSWLQSHSMEQGIQSLHSDMVRRVIDRMHAKLKENWHVRDMARYAGMGERNFRDVFNSETGYPPKKYYDSLMVLNSNSVFYEIISNC